MKPASHLKRAGRAALQWRLLVLWTGFLLVPTLFLAIPVWRVLGTALDHSVHATALARQFDALGAFDMIAAFGRDSGMIGTAGVLALLVTLALSPLLSGMAITAVCAATPLRFGPLMTGAFAQYGRMARMLVWSAVPLGIAAALGGWIVKWVGKHNGAAIVEDDAALATMPATGAALLLFAVAHVTVEAGRAVLATEPQRTSAVKAWWAGVRFLLRRAVAAMGSWFIVALVGLALAGTLTVLRLQLPPLGAGATLLGLVLVQAPALCLAWSRQARLFALVALMPGVPAAVDVRAPAAALAGTV